jgi:NADPH:quinone reductase-like Zn-dependent oxidoreductase
VDKLELRDVPEPKVGPGEVKVRVAGASLNPIDWKLRSRALKERMPLNFPFDYGERRVG